MNERDIAADLLEYLREHPEVCAEGNVNGWRWIRFHDDAGEWRATKYDRTDDRLKSYVVGDVLEESAVMDWLVSNPVTLVPQSEARLWRPKDQTVWEDADQQDVFTDRDRCFWCGASERTHDLQLYETTEDGDCWLCPDCYESWERDDQIVAPIERGTGGADA